MDKIKNIISKIPPGLFVPIGLFILIAIFKKSIGKTFTSLFESMGIKTSKEDIRINTAQVRDVKYDVTKMSIPISEAIQRANNLYNKMKGAGTGDVLAECRGLTPDDLKCIYVQFGTKNGQNLSQWFIGDLSDTNLVLWFGKTEKTLMNEIWKDTGIQF